MSILDPIQSLFAAKTTQLYWARLLDDHAGLDFRAEPIVSGEAYVVVRLREMSLGYTRKLWRKFYPVVHGFVRHAGREEHQIIGPGRLKDISEADLDRVVNLNQRLAGPIPYDGGDLEIVAGLYSVPAGDAAKALIQTVGDLAGLAGLAAANIPQIANAVKSGLDSIFRLQDCQLQLGIRDTRPGGQPLQSGIYVGIAGPREEIVGSELWLEHGRLVRGEDPRAGKPYDAHDYMVLEIERRVTREDWATLPGIAAFEKRFSDVMRTGAPVADKRKQLGAIWPDYIDELVKSRDLTGPDKKRIEAAVAADLKARLAQLDVGNPFETRAMGPKSEQHAVRSDDFDFMDVDTSAVAPVQAAGTPF